MSARTNRLRGFAAVCAAVAAVSAHAAEPSLELIATIPLPKVDGRIDHLAADPTLHRLFIASLGNNTVEVVDTRGGWLATLTGLSGPQGIAYVADADRLFVASGGAQRLDVFDPGSLSQLNRVQPLPDADNVRDDFRAGNVIVGYGTGGLAIVNVKTGGIVGRIALPAHPESFQLEKGGARVFINVPGVHAVMVADRVTRELLASWPLPAASGNYPMALDEASRRLFIGTRKPAALLVYDIDSGVAVARLETGGDADDVFYDERRGQVYVICGEGRIDVFHRESADRYTAQAQIVTAPRARTGLFVPEEDRLYVAVPATQGTPARILVYRIR
jgi:DNA-binding beta-propeller fold protein YncE